MTAYTMFVPTFVRNKSRRENTQKSRKIGGMEGVVLFFKVESKKD
jgi:hypothetical protein